MLYEVTLYGMYYDQQTVNRFNYVSTGTPAAQLGSLSLLKAMGFVATAGVFPAAGIFTKLRTIVNSNWKAVNIVSRAASDYDVTDFYDLPYVPNVAGLADSAFAASPVLSFGFRTNRVRTDIDRGSKRFAGVGEGQMAGGGKMESVTIGQMTALADAMSAVLVYDDEGNSISFSPCVVSKLEYTTPRGRKAYKYYPTLAQQLEHTATGVLWQAIESVRTQGSRQYGNGI